MDEITQSRRLLPGFFSLWKSAWQAYKSRISLYAGLTSIPTAIYIIGFVMGGAVGGVISVVNMLVVLFMLLAVYQAIVTDQSEGGWTNIKRLYGEGLPKFWSVVWLAIISSLAVIGGSILLVIPGIIVWIWVIFSLFLLFGDGKRGFSALVASRYLVKDYWWPVFGRIVAFFALTLIPVAILNRLVSALTSSMALEQGIMMILSLMVVLPFELLFIYALYKELRGIKSGEAIAGEKVQSTGRWLKGLSIFGLVAGIIAIIVAVAFSFILASLVGSMISPDVRQQFQTGLQTKDQVAIEQALQQALGQLTNKNALLVATGTATFPNCAVEQIACPAGQGSLIYSLAKGQCGLAYCVPTKCANNIKGGVLDYLVCTPSIDPAECPKCSVVSGR